MSEFALKQYQKRLQAVGYAQFRPAFPDNPYDERNRRIDIVILEGKAPEFELFLD
jgi:flagellar motor protein MotB